MDEGQGTGVGVVVPIGRAADDLDVEWVEQERAGCTVGREEVDAAVLHQVDLARDLGEAPVARLGATPGREPAIEIGAVVGPDDDPPAVPVGQGVGPNRCFGGDDGERGVAHVGVVPLVVAADQDRAAPGIAGGIHVSAVEQSHLVAE